MSITAFEILLAFASCIAVWLHGLRILPGSVRVGGFLMQVGRAVHELSGGEERQGNTLNRIDVIGRVVERDDP